MYGCIYVRCLPRAVTAGSQYTGKRLQAVRGIYLYFLLPVIVFRPGRQGSGGGKAVMLTGGRHVCPTELRGGGGAHTVCWLASFASLHTVARG